MELLDRVKVSILHDEINNSYNLLISDDYITAKFTCDENERIIPPGCIVSNVHIHREQNLVAYRQLSSMMSTKIIYDDSIDYLLPGKHCQIEVDDELKIYYPISICNNDNEELVSMILEHIYVDASEYETIDGSRSEFVKNRIEIFNKIVKDHQDLLPKNIVKHNN